MTLGGLLEPVSMATSILVMTAGTSPFGVTPPETLCLALCAMHWTLLKPRCSFEYWLPDYLLWVVFLILLDAVIHPVRGNRAPVPQEHEKSFTAYPTAHVLHPEANTI